MISPKKLNRVFEKYNKLVGKLGGGAYNVYRPNYLVTDNTPSVIRNNVPYRVDNGGKKFLNVGFNQVMVFDTFGPRGEIIKTGDVLIRGTFGNPDIMSPSVTVLHWGEIDALVALRTTRRCHIVSAQDEDTKAYTYLYKNVLFDVIGQGYTNGQITQPYDKSGTPVPTDRFCLYTRPELTTGNYLGLTIIETDNTGTVIGRKWKIDQVDWSGPLMVLDVRRAI